MAAPIELRRPIRLFECKCKATSAGRSASLVALLVELGGRTSTRVGRGIRFRDQPIAVRHVQGENVFEPRKKALRETCVVAPGRLFGDEFALLANAKLAFDNVLLSQSQVFYHGAAAPRAGRRIWRSPGGAGAYGALSLDERFVRTLSAGHSGTTIERDERKSPLPSIIHAIRRSLAIRRRPAFAPFHSLAPEPADKGREPRLRFADQVGRRRSEIDKRKSMTDLGFCRQNWPHSISAATGLRSFAAVRFPARRSGGGALIPPYRLLMRRQNSHEMNCASLIREKVAASFD
jgi:hypothetical protein